MPATAPPAHAATCLYVSSYHAGYVWNDGIERGLEQALYCLRRGDTVARLGGDEFTAIFEDIGDRRDVARAAQAILEAVGEPVTLCGRTCKVTASIGITLYPQDATEPQCLIMYADNAMYRAKQQAGDTYGFYAPGVNPIPARPPP